MIPSLLERYEREWADLQRKPIPASPDRPTNPLLLNVSPSYFEADCKVMIFGQETNDWEGPFPTEGGVDDLLMTYDSFYNTGYCYSRYGGAFWNGIGEFKRPLDELLRPSGRAIQIIWNNVIKIGKANEKNKPSAAILEWEDAWFDVVRFEVSTLKPDVIVFFCGWRYDPYINRIFPGASYERVNQRRSAKELARVKLAEFLPDGSTIRTYHPGYLWRVGFDEYLKETVAAIRLGRPDSDTCFDPCTIG